MVLLVRPARVGCAAHDAALSAVQGGDLRMALWRDYLNGTHIFDWRNKGRDVALAVARGLHFLHRQSVVHRQGGAGSYDCDSCEERRRSSVVAHGVAIGRCCARLTVSRVAVTRGTRETMWAGDVAGAQPWSTTCSAYVMLAGPVHAMQHLIPCGMYADSLRTW